MHHPLTELGDPAPAFTTATVAADHLLISVAEQWDAMTQDERDEWIAHHGATNHIGDPAAFIARLITASGTDAAFVS